VAVASAGHVQVRTSRQTDNHASTPPLSFLQAGCPSCRPVNSVKALKALWGPGNAPIFLCSQENGNRVISFVVVVAVMQDYQLDMDQTRRRIHQAHMVQWIVDGVLKSITPQQVHTDRQTCRPRYLCSNRPHLLLYPPRTHDAVDCGRRSGEHHSAAGTHRQTDMQTTLLV